MSIAPLTPSFGFGVTPGFGINPAYGVSATPERTRIEYTDRPQDVTTFGELLANKITANAPANPALPTVPAVQSVQATDATGRVAASQMGDFLSGKLGELSALHQRSDALAVAAATGDLKDIHEYTIAANEAGIATQLAVSVRDKALQSFNDIIRMQL